MRTANPALNSKTFSNFRTITSASDAMTIQGTVNKTVILLLLLVVPAVWIWQKTFAISGQEIFPWIVGGAIGGFIVALITVFKKQWASVTAPLYAILEGLFLGGISAIFEAKYGGIVFQAVVLTFGILFCLLLVYKSGLIKVTENFKLGVVAATGGIALVYFISFILGMFGVNMPFIHDNGIIGIGISIFIVIIAALNLVLDFDFIDNGAASSAPKYMEWYAAFGLLVTLVWLYLEIIRLLAKLSSRR